MTLIPQINLDKVLGTKINMKPKTILITPLGARSYGEETSPGDLTVVASRTHRYYLLPSLNQGL